MKFAGWYYNPEEGVAEKVASEKELYDGAKLDAGWTTQIDSNVIDEIIAVGLPDDAKLVVEDLTLEKTYWVCARYRGLFLGCDRGLHHEPTGQGRDGHAELQEHRHPAARRRPGADLLREDRGTGPGYLYIR